MATPAFTASQGPGKEGQAVPSERLISVTSAPGLVSVLIPCCGMLEYTRHCVASLLRHTRPPFELIFLDIGSLDGTVEYLGGIKTAAGVRVEIVSTPTDLGIAEATREALRQARGQYLVLLNNDTIVTPHWIEHLLGLIETSPAFGLAGPMSNYAAPPQLVETVPYRVGRKKAGGNPWDVDTDAVHRFAMEFKQAHQGQWMEAERLGGFCLLMKRVVLDRIGPDLHKWTDLSLFDSDILSSKAKQAGFTLACCRDLFIHHFGTRVFAQGAPSEKKDEKERSRQAL